MPDEIPPPRELVVFTDPTAQTRITPSRARSLTGRRLGRLGTLARDSGVEFRPTFGKEDRWHADSERRGGQGHVRGRRLARMGACYSVAADDNRIDDLAAELLDQDVIEGAYVQAVHVPPPTTPDYVDSQIYLDTAPGGVAAEYAWLVPGGRGAGVKIVDIEYGWNFGHEDLPVNSLGLLAGDNNTALFGDDHGTAVLGVLGSDLNAFGVTGICANATVGTVGQTPNGRAWAIAQAAAVLAPGDVMLLEVQTTGPAGEGKFIPVEWLPAEYLAIRAAADAGIVVVEAGANGAEDLDAVLYDTGLGFPPWWTNPFRRTGLDAGAVIVGAGAPPPGTHGQDWGTDRSRLDFSNYGSCLDVQGWGREVTTCGYGLLQNVTNRDYTDRFSGTSSGSAVVAGVVTCVQGALLAAGMPRLNPAQMRAILRSTGSPQQDTAGRPATQRIGTRPDLKQLLAVALAGEYVGARSLRAGRLFAMAT